MLRLFLAFLILVISVEIGQARDIAPSLMADILVLRSRIASHWQVPRGAHGTVVVRIRLNREGRVSEEPLVLNTGSDPVWAHMRDSVIQAIYASQPFDMLKPEDFDNWKEIDFTFVPTVIDIPTPPR